MTGAGERPAPTVSALPYAVPRSALPGIVWPALPDPAASRLLALQLQLEQSQWWPPELIEARQFEQLQQVLVHAWRTVPFYAQRLAAVDPNAPIDRERWTRIPILTRQDVQLNKESLLSRAVPPQHGTVRESSSSGSTGRPLTLHTTDYVTLLWQGFTLREHLWHRRDLGGKLCAIRYQADGGAMPPEGERQPGWGPSTDIAYVSGPCTALNIKASIREQAAWLMREDPDYVLTYPTIALDLMRFFQENNVKLPRLRELRTFSESVPAGLRQLARDFGSVNVVDMYTAVETGYIALQCPGHEHYHVQSENLYVEVLDRSGRRCAPGETGRVVVTTLHNFATPLIRYDIGDYAQAGAPCPCGRGLPVLTRILGRVRNMLTLPGGERFWPVFGVNEFRRLAPVLQLQVVQPGLDELEVRLVVARALSRGEEEAVAGLMRANLGHPFRIAFRYLDAIPRGPTGKFEEFMSLLEGNA
jgi:phenylacetate-CoA ligase